MLCLVDGRNEGLVVGWLEGCEVVLGRNDGCCDGLEVTLGLVDGLKDGWDERWVDGCDVMLGRSDGCCDG